MKKLISASLLFAIYFSMFAPLMPSLYAQRISGRSTVRTMTNNNEGLNFTLSEGVEGAENRTKTDPITGQPLDGSTTESLLKRLRAIEAQPDDQAEFKKRLGSLPAPKKGEKIDVKFPAPETRSTPSLNNDQQLEVLRFSPEGEVSLAPDLSVTFSQPMVAITSQDEAAKTVPVQFSPNVEGNWRWLGTKTLMFDTDKRFPMASVFTVKVPAGTKAATGQVLAKEVSWTFTTPPPKVERMLPSGQTTTRDAMMFVSFDQDINPEAVIKTITVKGAGKVLPIRLATQAEIDAEKSFAYYIKDAQPKRWMAFRAVNADGSTENALPAASSIVVSVNKGTPSAEGPRTTEKDQTFSFQTFSPFVFTGGECGWSGKQKCTPFDMWYMRFNNYIDTASFKPEMVKVEPAVEGLKIYPSGNTIAIEGYKKGNTTYKVTINAGLKDTFGQISDKASSATFKVGQADASLYAQGGNMIVLDPTAKPNYSIYSINHNSVKLKLYKVTPNDWEQFRQYVRYMNYDNGKRPQPPGQLITDKILPLEKVTDELVETRIDLAKALNGGFGSVIVDIEPTVKRDKYDRTRIYKWIQSTQIGLDAFVDNDELVGFATELKTGKPLSGVELTIKPNGIGDALSSTTEKPAEEEGLVASVWRWFSEFGSSVPEGISSTDTEGVEAAIETIEQTQINVTPANGVARLPLGKPLSNEGQGILIAKKGNDIAFLPENPEYYWQDYSTWYKKGESISYRWFTFDDRKMYKPKEEVSVKGYLRKITPGINGDVEFIDDANKTITWSAKDSRNNEIASGTTQLNAFGAFDLKFTIPDNANLGYSNIHISSGLGTNTIHSYQVQEFRRPEFEVSAKVETEGPHIVGQSAMVAVDAKYYAGGGLANADTNWTVTANQTSYTPPNRGDYTFGTWVPWWRDWGRPGGGKTETFKGLTDAAGKHLLKIDFNSVDPARPYSLTASAAVQDVNRQTWSSQTSLLVHPSSLYVGLRSPRTFVQKGEKINVETITTDIDGNLVAGRDVNVKAQLKDYQFKDGSWQEVVIDEQSCAIKSADKGVSCEFIAKQGGRYTISASVMDDKERFNESEITIWVPGGKTPPKREVEQEEVQIIPSKKDFAPGDVAELLVISPFTPAEGILTLRRDGIVKAERFTMTGSSMTLKIPIEEKYLPNLIAQVDLVGASPRTDDKGEINDKIAKRPAFASGNITLPVSTASRKLTVTADPIDKTLTPGGSTKVNVEVKDASGEPVANSEVAIVVVDESVLALTGYSVADPMGIFYTSRGSGVSDHHSRSQILLGNPLDVASEKLPPPAPPPAPVMETSMALGAAAPSEARKMRYAAKSADRAEAENSFVVDGVDDKDQTNIEVRQNFNALALWSPSVKTDSNGKAVVDVKLPDNLTRYRVTAVSVDQGNRFGKTESNITARQPLMVRPSAPRFMNFGDKIELPVVIQNQTDKDMAVDVAVRATNATLGSENAAATGLSQAGRRLMVKANDRVEVRFPASTVKAGTARFQFAVTSGSYNDAAEISLPVWTPATTEAFATYGTTDQNGAIFQPVQTPGDVYPQFGGLEVTTSSTQLQELTDAFIYLSNYQFECSEQISSRMISTAALRDVLNAFKAKDMPTKEQLEAKFKRDVEILQSRQRSDGSFGLWKRDRERYEYPFLTVHVAHALTLAKSKGYAVPDEMLNRTKPYLKDVEKHMRDEWYRNSPEVRWTISAYALYVRDMMGDKDAAKAKKLLAEATIEKIPFEALGWVLSVLANDQGSSVEVDAIKRFLMNRTTETAATANFVTNYKDGGWLIMQSNRRADGVLLEALIKSDVKNDLIPKLVRGLLAHRTKGHWGSTQENVFILLAMDKYFNAFEKVTPDFVTKVWLGDAYAGEQIFKGRSVDSNQLDIPMSYLVGQGGSSNLILDKQGAGRLYYRIGMKYAPKNLKLEPADYGFTVLRKYEAVDNAEDVVQNADGTWTIKAGARVRVKLTMVAQARRYHVALVDNLPAGLEILNPGLAVTEAIPADPNPGNTSVTTYGTRSFGHGWWWRANWFEHQNFRDERAEAFASLLWEGVYNYSYVARATTPGQFVVPPAKAEEMYHPETFGRTGTDFVNIK